MLALPMHSSSSQAGSNFSKLNTPDVPKQISAQTNFLSANLSSIVKSELMSNSSNSTSSSGSTRSGISSRSSNSSLLNRDDSTSPPPSKKIKCESKEMVDVCVGTSVGTITEPECLGPCEPGTSVTLEGIVWHETEGGVLVVNVTWRGKTYVGTLLDCTRHDWAPPRYAECYHINMKTGNS